MLHLGSKLLELKCDSPPRTASEIPYLLLIHHVQVFLYVLYFVPTYHHNSQNRCADATKHETFPRHRQPLTSAWRWTASEEEPGSLVSESYLLGHQHEYEWKLAPSF